MTSLTYNFKDKKGHPLETVWIRRTPRVGPRRIAYLYCIKCDRFSKVITEIVI